MPGFYLYQSNSLERLADRFCSVMCEDPLLPMTSEHILVQSIGMGRWLSLTLSEITGIWANSRYIYPNVFMDMLFSAAFPEYKKDLILSKSEMQWALFAMLPEMKNDPVFEPLRGYCEEPLSLKLFQLCGKIADLFDQYITARPDMISAWEEGEDFLVTPGAHEALESQDLWQSSLWRALILRQKHQSRAHFRKLLSKVTLDKEALKKIPPRISVFGVSTLFPFHLDLLEYLSDYIDVRLFVLAPSREYIADIESKSVRAKKLRRLILRGETPEENVQANPLVVSLGSLARDFQYSLLSRNVYDLTVDEDFIEPSSASLLADIQNDILSLRDGTLFPGKKTIDTEDRSLLINSSYGVLREVESLYDYLIDLMNKNHAVNPRDILVMTTDIDLYAPYIELVFGGKRNEGTQQYIPYSIADRNMRCQSVIAGVMMKILLLSQERFAASVVLDILGSPAVMKKFGITHEESGAIADMVRDARIRWGRDEEERERECGVSFRENSWEFGIDRLVMGYASGSRIEDMYAGVVPSSAANSELLSRFIGFYRVLRKYSDLIREDFSPAQWCGIFTEILEEFFAADRDNAWEFESIRKALALILEGSSRAKSETPIPLSVMIDSFTSELDDHAAQYGFLNGRVTFCAMLPMRSIPFRVICILGLDDGIFPRSTRLPTFDLTGKKGAKGDRSQRNDDRYIFLESILSARESLYLSFNGRSPFDNSMRPSSVLVREIGEYIRYAFKSAKGDGADLLRRITCEHKLHPFSRDYFLKGSNLFSYNVRACEIARMLDRRADADLFDSHALKNAAPGQELVITPSELMAFFRNPARWFCAHRLGMRVPYDDPMIEDVEPLDIDFSDSVFMEERMIELCAAGSDAVQFVEYCKGAGILPSAVKGELDAEILYAKIRRLYERAKSYLAVPSETLDVDMQFSVDALTVIVKGDIADFRNGIIRLRSSEWKHDLVSFWIEHLLASGVSESNSRFFLGKAAGKDKETVWAIDPLPKDEARAHLQPFVSYFVKGLSTPVRFFPRTSRAYAQKIRNGGSEAEALEEARKTWAPERLYGESRPESADDYSIICFGRGYSLEGYPLDAHFADIAREVYFPILDKVKGL